MGCQQFLKLGIYVCFIFVVFFIKINSRGINGRESILTKKTACQLSPTKLEIFPLTQSYRKVYIISRVTRSVIAYVKYQNLHHQKFKFSVESFSLQTISFNEKHLLTGNYLDIYTFMPFGFLVYVEIKGCKIVKNPSIEYYSRCSNKCRRSSFCSEPLTPNECC